MLNVYRESWNSFDSNDCIYDFFPRETIREYSHITMVIGGICGSSWLLMNIAAAYIDRPSRKSANLSYAFFIVSTEAFLLTNENVKIWIATRSPIWSFSA